MRREQVLDYLKVRRFRQTLLCPAAIDIDRTLRPESLDRLAVSSPAQATDQHCCRHSATSAAADPLPGRLG